MRGMLYRAFMAARFHRATYRDVLRDHEAILNALGIVILAGIAYAVGQSSAVGESAEQGLDAGAIGDRLLGVWFASITFMVGWLIWAGIAYGVGRVFQRDEATFREILRVLGVCFGPGLLLFLTAITPVEGVVFNAVMIWMLVAGVVAGVASLVLVLTVIFMIFEIFLMMRIAKRYEQEVSATEMD